MRGVVGIVLVWLAAAGLVGYAAATARRRDAALGPREVARKSAAGRCVVEGVVLRDGAPVRARVEVRPILVLSAAALRARPRGFSAALALDMVAAPAAVVLSGADGGFRAAGLAPASFRIVAIAEDGGTGDAAASCRSDGARARVTVPVRTGSETLRVRWRTAEGGAAAGWAWAERDFTWAPGSVWEHGSFAYVGARPLDAAGRWSTSGLAPGRYRVVLLDRGRVRATSESIEVPQKEEADLRVGAVRSIRGTVVAADDDSPVSGAEVEYSCRESKGVALQGLVAGDGAGKFSVPATRAPTSLEVRANGHVTGHARVENGEGEVRVRLVREARLMGTVTSPDGLPVAGLRIMSDARSSAVIDAFLDRSQGWTDAAGRYEVKGLPHGDLALWAEGPGSITRGLGARGRPGKTVSLALGRTTTADLVVVPGGRVEGRILDSTGEPIAGAVLVATASGSPMLRADAVTDGAGHYLFDSLAPGVEYEVEVEAPGLAPFVAYDATPPDRGAATQDVRLPGERWLRIRVVEETTLSPIPGARVVVGSLRGPRARFGTSALATVTDGAGWLPTLRMPPGRLGVQVRGPGIVPPRLFEFLPLEVRADQTEVEVEVARGLDVSGWVCFPDGEPASGVRIRVDVAAERRGRPRYPVGERFQTGDDGAFSIPGAPLGRYRRDVEAVRDGVPYAKTVEVDAGARDVAIGLVPAGNDGGGSVLLLVVGPDGDPVPSASVAVDLVGERRFKHLDDGRLVIHGALAAEARVEIWRAESRERAPLPLAAAHAIVREPTRTVEVVLVGESVITGRVVGPDGAGVPGVVVRATPLWPGEAKDRRTSVHEEATSDDAGHFRIGRLAAVRHRLEAFPSEGFLRSDASEVEAGAGDARLTVQRAGGFRVCVFDSVDRPIRGARVGAGERDDDHERIDREREFTRRSGMVGIAQPGASARTDARGEARLDGLDPSRPVRLTVDPPKDHPDLAPFVKEGWMPSDDAIWLTEAWVVTGTVTDATGKAVEGAVVWWQPESRLRMSSSREQRKVKTRPDGRFTIPSLPREPIDIRATPGEDLPPRVRWRPLAPGDPDPTLVVRPAATLVVRVEGADGKPPPAASSLTAYLAPDPFTSVLEDAEKPVGADGVVRFHGLDPAEAFTLWVGVTSDGCAAHRRGVRATGSDVVVRLEPAKEIRGRVRAPEGAHVLYVHLKGEGIGSLAHVGPAGDFVFCGLPDGEYEISDTEYVDHAPWSAKVRCRAGDTVDLVLAPQRR